MPYHFQLDALERLLPAGFKKQRELFFLIREPNILVLFRKFDPTGKDAFYLAFTHTFFTGVKDKNGKYLLPSLLEHYPLSIAATELKAQYSKHSTVQAFDCALHHLSQTFYASKENRDKPGSSLFSLLGSFFAKKPAEDIANPVEVTLAEGMRLLAEFSPALSCQILLKQQQFSYDITEKQLAECRHFLAHAQ
jgi:hypothetical protein